MTPHTPKPFKKPPRRHQPKGCQVLYEDKDILVVDKANGLLTVSTELTQDKTAYHLITDYVRKGNPKSRARVFIVHRLDRDTSGLLVFAKSVEAKNYLQEHWPDFKKTYYAVVLGHPAKAEDVLTSYLAENDAHRVFATTDTKIGKLAKTAYRVLRSSAMHSLLEVDLLTGRKNQIRVQLADIGCSIVGDRKYGEAVYGSNKMALHAARMSIRHPYSHELMEFESPMPRHFEGIMKR